jgi:hypothetical protein
MTYHAAARISPAYGGGPARRVRAALTRLTDRAHAAGDAHARAMGWTITPGPRAAWPERPLLSRPAVQHPREAVTGMGGNQRTQPPERGEDAGHVVMSAAADAPRFASRTYWPDARCEFVDRDMCGEPAAARVSSRALPTEHLSLCGPHRDHMLQADPYDAYVSWAKPAEATASAPGPSPIPPGPEQPAQPVRQAGMPSELVRDHAARVIARLGEMHLQATTEPEPEAGS